MTFIQSWSVRIAWKLPEPWRRWWVTYVVQFRDRVKRSGTRCEHGYYLYRRRGSRGRWVTVSWCPRHDERRA